MADEIRMRLAPYIVHLLPATRRYKVDVVFGAATRVRDEDTGDDGAPLGANDRAVIRALQGDTEVRLFFEDTQKVTSVPVFSACFRIFSSRCWPANY